MKIKKLVKVLCVTMVVGTFALSACGKKSSSSSASSKDYELTDVSFPLKEKVTLKFLTGNASLAPQDPNDMLIVQRLQENTNVEIEWKNYQNDFAEKRNLDIASGDLPDAIFNAQAGDADLLKWAKDGTIIPLEEHIDKYMPNLKKVLDEKPEYRSLLTASDGHIYSLPWIEELGEGKESIHTVNCMAWINKAWLDKLGLAMPTTTDELLTVLKAFKAQDPNGNGKADEIPFSFITNGGNEDLKLLFAAFGDGTGDNDDHLIVDNDRKVQFTANTDGYKDAIKYFNTLYKEGLMDPEAFEQDWNTYVSKGSEKRYGVYFSWDKNNITGANDDYVAMPLLVGANGKKNVTRTNNYGFSRDRFVITSANKNIELTCKWVDQLFEPTQSVQDNWGTYGDEKNQNIFEYDESKKMLTHLALEGSAPVEVREKTAIAGPLAILDSYFGTVTTMPDDAQTRLDTMAKEYFPYVTNEYNYPRIFQSSENTQKIADIDADMTDYIARKRDEWITKGTIDSEWEDYKKELSGLGLDEWLKIKQEGYDQFQKNIEK